MKTSTSSGGSGLVRSRRALPVLLAAALSVGCYRYAPVEPAAAPVGSHVRVRALQGGDVAGSSVRSGETRELRGEVLPSPTADTLLFSVNLEPGSPTAPTRGLRSTVAVPLMAVTDLEVRRLDRIRTGALVAGGAALAVVLVNTAFDIHNGTEGTDNTGGVDNAVIPLFKLPW